MLDRLDEDDRQHFEELRRLLDAAGLEHEIDTRLVRGLDYYTRTVFEFTSDALGAQSGVGGGGRYDRLIQQIGGDPTPAVGWATGLERIAQALGEAATGRQAAPSFVFVITEPEARERVFALMSELRREGVGATMDLGGRSLKGQMKQAHRAGARFAVIVGPEEWSREAAAIRDMRAQEQEEVSLSSLPRELLERVET
jgi:histidyl-tRNA synthetase